MSALENVPSEKASDGGPSSATLSRPASAAKGKKLAGWQRSHRDRLLLVARALGLPEEIVVPEPDFAALLVVADDEVSQRPKGATQLARCYVALQFARYYDVARAVTRHGCTDTSVAADCTAEFFNIVVAAKRGRLPAFAAKTLECLLVENLVEKCSKYVGDVQDTRDFVVRTAKEVVAIVRKSERTKRNGKRRGLAKHGSN